MILPVDIENMNSKMQVDKLCLIKKIPQNTRSHCPFKPTTLLFNTILMISSPCFVSHDAPLLPLLWHLQRVWLHHFWVSWKIRGCTMLTILKETRECFICTSEKKKKFEKKRKPHRSSDSGVLCGPLCRHHAWKWNRWKSEILVTEFVERCLSDGVCNYD